MGFVPQIQINQTPLVMEYRTTPAKWEISTVAPQISAIREPIQFQIKETQPSRLAIDQSRAFQATGLGGPEFFSRQIYTESKQIVLQYIAKSVADGNRLAQILNGDALQDIHADEPLAPMAFNYFGEASIDNVDINYQRKEIEIHIHPGSLRFDVKLSEPTYQYTPPMFEAYAKQQNNVNIIPPQMDEGY